MDFGSVESVAAATCFLRDAVEERCDRVQRATLRTKPHQLWMARVSTSPACKHFLRKQGFAPRGNQPFGIQIAGVQGPKSHRDYSNR